eukprot:12217316-Alexandrium_andersonii.AAC.1
MENRTVIRKFQLDCPGDGVGVFLTGPVDGARSVAGARRESLKVGRGRRRRQTCAAAGLV